MDISDEIDDATIAIDETTILENKATIWPEDICKNRLTSKFCSVNYLVIIECLFSSRMSLVSLYNHLCYFQSENVFQIPVLKTKKTRYHAKPFLEYKRRFR